MNGADVQAAGSMDGEALRGIRALADIPAGSPAGMNITEIGPAPALHHGILLATGPGKVRRCGNELGIGRIPKPSTGILPWRLGLKVISAHNSI